MRTQKHTHPNLFRFLLRAFQILRRYGLSTRKMESKLEQYISILRQYNICPTFPITAEIVKRHPHIIGKYASDGVEFAIHGFRHVDYSNLSEEELFHDLEHSIDVFKQHNIAFSGFRFPYLKHNQQCMDALSRSAIKWDSSSSVYWDVIGSLGTEKVNAQNYENMLNQYNYKKSSKYISLPRVHGNLLEIPVSLPDDDLLERAGIKGNGLAKDMWGKILEETHSRGQLFTLQLHPERISLFKEALISIIESSRQLSPEVWIARLSEVYDWWQERKAFSLSLNEKAKGVYEVEAKCSPRATLLVRSDNVGKGHFCDGFSIVNERNFVIKSPKYPIIGAPVAASEGLISFLMNEGFIFRLSEKREQFSFYLDGFDDFSVLDEMKVLDTIRNENAPLIRFWRWPRGCRSALAISGDIDALSSADFFVRLSSQ